MTGESFMHSSRNLLLAVVSIAASANPASAGVPSDPASQASIVGQPASLEAAPAAVMLSGPRSGSAAGY